MKYNQKHVLLSLFDLYPRPILYMIKKKNVLFYFFSHNSMYAQLYESNKACNRKQMVSYTGSPSAVTQAHGMQHVDAGYSCVVQH